MSEGATPIRILHVDDDPDFAELVAVYLQTEDDQFDVESADSAGDGLERLRDESFDCVVSDHDMPGQNGIEFLNAVREERADLPFILFTGKGSEEVASDAISAGVTDYLQKGTGTDQYAVLANRTRNAVERWRAEQEAERVTTRLEAITANSNDAILTVDSENTVRFVNRAVEDLFGYEPAELSGEPLTALLPAERREGAPDEVTRYLTADERQVDWTDLECAARHRDGHEVPVSISFSTFVEGGERNSVAVIRDVSDRVRMEAELRERERRFRQMAENIQEMVWMADPNSGEVLYVNPAYEEIWGRSPEGLYENPESFLDAIHPADRGRVGDVLRPQSVGAYEEEYRITRPNGDVRWVYDRAVPIRDDAGEIYRTVGIASDVTERKEREREYDRVLEQLGHTEQIADVGGWEIDPETRAVSWSDHLFELLGWEDDGEPPLEGALDVYTEADRPRVATAVEDAIAAGESFTVEARFRRPDGEVRWAEVRGEPRVEGGDVATLRGAVHDITDRKRRERALHRMYDITSDPNDPFEEKVQALLELGRRELDTEYGTLSKIRGGEYVFEYVDTDDDSIRSGDVVPVSATNCELVASSEETVVIGDVERDLPGETDRIGFAEWGVSCYIGAPVFLGDDVYGTFCFYDTEPRPGRFSEWEETLVDLMSNWVSGELQRRRANERLQAQNEQLSRFASIVSHDLRNPLNVAKGRLEIARAEYDDEHLDAVGRAHDRMDALIDDVLTLARAGEQVGEVERVALAGLGEDCWRNVATDGATLVTDVERTVMADGSRLRQLFENLLRNSVEHGGEAVTVTVGELEDGFYVEDDGVGISAGERTDVFEAGYSTGEGGTGFGLHIVEQVATAHGWEVSVTDGAEGGARFEVSGVEFAPDRSG